MNNKLLIIGNDKQPDEVKKLLVKLLCTQDIENVESSTIQGRDNDFICADGMDENIASKLKSLGYKTVLFAYTDEAVNHSGVNSDLEKNGFKFEDGV
jgi:hypothetical protein